MEDWPTSVRTGNFLDLPALMSSLGFAGVSNTAVRDFAVELIFNDYC